MPTLHTLHRRMRRAVAFGLLGAMCAYFVDPRSGSARRRRARAWCRDASPRGSRRTVAAELDVPNVPGPAVIHSGGFGSAEDPR